MYPSDIRPLTSLRIGAAIWVLVYHFRDHLGLDLGRYGLAAKGYLGVDLFFILSGFILSHVYLKAWEERRFNYGSFLWARLARVYPMHLVTLAGTLGIWLAAKQVGAVFDPVAFDLSVIPQHLLMIHAWGTTPTAQWNFPSWSISAEWFAYLAFPAAAIFSLTIRRWALGGVLAAAALFIGLFLAAQARGVHFTEMTAQIGAVRIIPSFLMGAALHRLGSSVSLPRGLAWAGALAAVAWIAVAASLNLSDMLIWPALALLIFSLGETSKTDPASLIAAPLLVYLGEVSYAVYMTHLPVDIVYFHALDRIAPNLSGPVAWAAWAGVFVVCLTASIVAYHLVERPARNWMRAHDPFTRRPKLEPAHEPVI
jgi:peptidoglycan/LPS O-acetylase OafA/YrhL